MRFACLDLRGTLCFLACTEVPMRREGGALARGFQASSLWCRTYFDRCWLWNWGFRVTFCLSLLTICYCGLQLTLFGAAVSVAAASSFTAFCNSLPADRHLQFVLQFILNSAPESSLFRFGIEIRFWSCLLRVRIVLLWFANQCLQIAVEWLRKGFSLLRLRV